MAGVTWSIELKWWLTMIDWQWLCICWCCAGQMSNNFTAPIVGSPPQFKLEPTWPGWMLVRERHWIYGLVSVRVFLLSCLKHCESSWQWAIRGCWQKQGECTHWKLVCLFRTPEYPYKCLIPKCPGCPVIFDQNFLLSVQIWFLEAWFFSICLGHEPGLNKDPILSRFDLRPGKLTPSD